jgi:riboflavin synthase
MFTGIIEGLGSVLFLKTDCGQALLRIKPLFYIDQFKQGESIAVNGCCLTVIKFAKDWFEAYASTETHNYTNLKHLKTGSKVNLERALKMDSRFGGHFVTGHIDGLAKVTKISSAKQSKIFHLTIDTCLIPYLVTKGSITLDGVSLTINECSKNQFTVNIIPETLQATILSDWKTGYQPNIETDLIGKYVHKQTITNTSAKAAIQPSFLIENGF